MSILLLMPFLESNCFLYFTNASSYNEESNEVICANTISINDVNRENDEAILPDISEGIMYLLEYSNESVLFSHKLKEQNVNLSQNIYANSEYMVQARTAQYTGILVAEKNITISSDILKFENVIIYSKKGNITISGEKSTLSGIIYAPHGSVNINSSDIDIQGKIIASKVSVKGMNIILNTSSKNDNLVEELPEYSIPHYQPLTMYYDEDSQKIGFENIEYNDINLFTRYDNEPFQKHPYNNGMKFEFDYTKKYFEAYAKYTDKYGVEYWTNIQTFIRNEDGLYSPAIRDENNDGVADAYQQVIDFGYIEDQDVRICLKKEIFDEINEINDKLLKKVNTNEDNVECRVNISVGDNVEAYINDSGERVLNIYNVFKNQKVLEMEGTEYIYYVYQKDVPVLKVGYSEEQQLLTKYTYNQKEIKKIYHNGMQYDFKYDDSRIKSVSINGKTIYDKTRIGHQEVEKFDNGFEINKLLDDKDNIIQLKGNSKKIYEWKYQDNQLKKSIDYTNHIWSKYFYDSYGELNGVNVSNEFSYKDSVDNLQRNRIIKYKKVNRMVESFEINSNNYVYKSGDIKEIRNSDGYQIYYNNKILIDKHYNNENAMETVVTDVQKNCIKYIYNNKGLLTDIFSNDQLNVHYSYNLFSELIREDNRISGETVLYSYDAGGNITNVKRYLYQPDVTDSTHLSGQIKEDVYTYDTNFTDQLKEYNGRKIVYDGQGNSCKYLDKYLMEWTQGNKLSKIVNNYTGNTVKYSYDADGNRISKKSGKKEKKFYYINNRIVLQKAENEALWFNYDVYGKPIGFMYNSVQFLYDVDEMGNVIGIFNKYGDKIVQYNYNGWGEITKIKGDNKIAHINPLRYRGYYYDEESGFYYLKNRYYDPKLKRMISMDTTQDTGFGLFSHNMYAYCENTPVNASNYSGNVPSWFDSKIYTAEDFLWETSSTDSLYNCYAFALKKYNKLCDPGEFSGKNMNSLNVSHVKNLVVSDLKKLGYSVHVIDKNSYKDFRKTHTIIALRTGDFDYHFMRYISGEYWGHKPGTTAKLVHKYQPWELNKWTTRSYNGHHWSQSAVSYTSSTVLIAYVC